MNRSTPFIALAAAALAGTSTLAYGIAASSSQIFGPSVYRGPDRRRSIALTFDDGPSEDSLRLIEYLAQQNIPATFFQCGMNVQRHPEIARAIHQAGHEIGNHNFSHPHLCPCYSRGFSYQSPRDIAMQFEKTQQILRDEAGVNPSLLRAPYGLRWFGMNAVQQQLGLLGVMWTVIGRDWILPSAKIAELVLRRAAPGGIVCLHDGRDVQPKPDVSEMLAAMQMIVPRLKEQGYTFETVTQLLRPDEAA